MRKLVNSSFSDIIIIALFIVFNSCSDEDIIWPINRLSPELLFFSSNINWCGISITLSKAFFKLSAFIPSIEPTLFLYSASV